VELRDADLEEYIQADSALPFEVENERILGVLLRK
jgi:hypothetical protein